MASAVQCWQLLLRREQSGTSTARHRRLRRIMLLVISYCGLVLVQPRMHDSSSADARCSDSFGEHEFKDHFRFRKEHFFKLLGALGLGCPHSPTTPRWIRVGRRGRRSLVRSDWALQVLLKRISSPSPYKDLRHIVGGSKTVLCDIWLYVLKYIYTNFTSRCMSLLPWESYMLDFARVLRDKGSPFDNLVGLVDGHFQAMCRPGGAGCVRQNMFDFEVYNGKEREHDLKFQAICLPNGMTVLDGPYWGPESDSAMLLSSETESELEELTQRLQLAEPLCVYGDRCVHVMRHTRAVPCSRAPIYRATD